MRDAHPLVVFGRLLTCTGCGHHVDLIELPAPWIDGDTYTCGECLQPATVTVRAPQPEPPAPPVSRWTYDPKTSPWPAGF